MRGRDDGTTRRSRVARGLVGLVGVLSLLFASLLISGPAGAATDSAQLGATGLVDQYNPSGGARVQVKPGDSVSFKTAVVPTGALRTLHLDSLANTLDGLLSGLIGFGVTADFSHLPGGHAGTKLTGKTAASFHFTSLGTYTFTYTLDKVVLGAFLPINLDGNQLKKAGVELNAQNEYVGAVIVSNAQPKITISGQLPKVSVQPRVGPVKLPKITIPGVNLPSVHVPSVPDLNPGGGGKGPGGKNSSGHKPTSPNAGGGTLSNQALPVPARVLNGLGGAGQGAGGSGGYYSSLLPGVSPLGTGQSLTLGSGNSRLAGSKVKGVSDGTGARKKSTDLAANAPSSAQLPVVLAIIAIIALSLVASTYARLFLLRRPSA